MGFLCLSSQIEVLSLPLISGSLFRKVLVLKLTLAQHSISDVITTILIFRWPLMRHCMDVDADLLLVGLK
ncbi:hypothetical protein MTR67_048312 [Solanum verrucosum]|uniref:Uncharacterized protein n=1 Tax=Solanum verrucosum TaxID=315347 RepID=A0AAF0UYN3_SOLVR|nr:hypothetical protein MTR67_048312 [Solanum verrucosum]